MRKTKRIVTSVLCSMILITSVLSASAASPYVVGRLCTACRVGNVSMTTTRVYQHDESFPCTHSGAGYDVFEVYEITVRENCDNCSYGTTYSYEDHVLKYCSSN